MTPIREYATITAIMELPNFVGSFGIKGSTYHINLSGGLQANEHGEYYMTLQPGDVVELECQNSRTVVRRIVPKTPIEQFVEGCLK